MFLFFFQILDSSHGLVARHTRRRFFVFTLSRICYFVLFVLALKAIMDSLYLVYFSVSQLYCDTNLTL